MCCSGDKCCLRTLEIIQESRKEQDKTSFQAEKLKTLQSSRGIPNTVNGYFFRTPEKNPTWEKI